MDNSDDFSSYGKRGETIAQGRPTLTKASHDQFQVTPSGEVGFKMQPRRLEDCIEYENEMRSALFSRASTSDRKIGSSHKPPVGHLEREVILSEKLQENENEMIAAADGKSRGVLNDQTAGAQGDHHLIYFDQTARPLAQGGPSNIFVNQKASSAQGDHLFSRRTAAPCGVSGLRAEASEREQTCSVSEGLDVPGFSRLSARSATHVFGPTNRAFPLYAGSTAIGNGQGRSSSPELQINTNNTNFENLNRSDRVRNRLNLNKNKKPAIFDGTNWEDYLVQFELVAAINNWDETEKAFELATSLRGPAQSVLTDLRPEMRVNYLHLTSALSSRFQPENQAEMYRAQMKNKLRGKNEPIPELGQDVKRLVRLAYPSAPTEVREQLARDCFVDSLNEAELEWAIFQGKAKNIDDAVQIALEYEAFQNGRRRRGLIKPVRRQTEVETDYEISNSRNQYLSGQIDDIAGRLAMIEKNDSTNKRPPLKCYYCGVQGHIKRFCPKLQSTIPLPDNKRPVGTKSVAVQTTNFMGNRY